MALKRKLDARAKAEHLSLSFLIERLLDEALLGQPVGRDLSDAELRARELAGALRGLAERVEEKGK